MNIFDGTLQGDDRILAVINLMNFNENKIKNPFIKKAVERLLRDCEEEAERFLKYKISRYMIGE